MRPASWARAQCVATRSPARLHRAPRPRCRCPDQRDEALIATPLPGYAGGPPRDRAGRDRPPAARTTTVPRRAAHVPPAAAGRQLPEPVPDQMAQLAAQLVALHRVPDRTGNDETGPRRRTRVRSGTESRCTTSAPRRLRRPARIAAVNSSRRRRRRSAPSTAARQAERRYAPLGAARGEDRATGPGPHAQPEAMGLRATAVVRLIGALAHGIQTFRAVPTRNRALAARAYPPGTQRRLRVGQAAGDQARVPGRAVLRQNGSDPPSGCPAHRYPDTHDPDPQPRSGRR